MADKQTYKVDDIDVAIEKAKDAVHLSHVRCLRQRLKEAQGEP